MVDPRIIVTEPAWQNFSSMYREAKTAREAKTSMEVSHHLTATLYFGISALEAFLNQRMRLHLMGATEEDIVEKLRKETLIKKIKKWPKQILGASINLRPETLGKLIHYNDIRGALTHPKHFDHRDYEPLEELNPFDVVDSIAEYIAQFLLAANEPFHYWLWGWNYLSPSKDGHDIALLPESQIVYSMHALGFPGMLGSPMSAVSNDTWRHTHMNGYAAYANVAKYLEGISHCEPKDRRFPFQPKLCRRWWDPSHHITCGHASQEAIQSAIDYNPYEQARLDAVIDRMQQMSRAQRISYIFKFFLFGK
ncbi:hypothetical protein [Lysobacter enzymogenes]|uniref:HEPN domain-containing protein n=1 Tax=Lysobacter enzymogenes TaxID=69 RepID=A0AAU9AJ90_LYSEN|nr:hypothetical protein [Lysobacter enzymogenes]BAV96204.1 conserved hypothetical protein [Lysobacter enzymogenes]